MTRYYLRNQKRKIEMVRKRGKNVRGKNCEEGVLRIPQKKNGLLNSQERDG
jgi:hypothetical protein